MRKKLRVSLADATLSDGSIRAYNSFDIIGDIAVTKVPQPSMVNYKDIAEAIMNRHTNVKAIYIQETAVNGEFRLRKLYHVAGEKRTRTVHKESGCLFNVDVDKCYFSHRLSHERLRVTGMVKPGETVVNMFAGVGCFSILIAKKK